MAATTLRRLLTDVAAAPSHHASAAGAVAAAQPPGSSKQQGFGEAASEATAASMSDTHAAVNIDSHPRLSVVAAWPEGGQGLDDWLRALAAVEGIGDVEIVVVAPGTDGAALTDVAGLRQLRHLEAAARTDIATRRRMGVAAATGDIILLTDPGEADFAGRLALVIHAYYGGSQ